MDTDYQRIEHAIRYLVENAQAQPSLDDLAGVLAVSPFHVQRLFRRYAGITPKQFLQHLTVERAKGVLDGAKSVLDATLEAGLSSPARLHDHFVTLEGVTPGEYKAAGEGLRIDYGVAGTPFGSIFVAQTPRGIAALSFVADAGEQALANMRNMWPRAQYALDNGRAAEIAAHMFEPARNAAPLRVLGVGTNFQVRVWRALLEIPFGQRTTYRALAAILDSPAGARAVGNALAANPVAYLIPCHRVIHSTGAIGHYRWQAYRKRALLAWEHASSSS
ncbi:MAG TPA: methylated-DNA--[protein]-cysteine S-methyltransferase [Candidatus Baltobacteraceae bacterium]|jgi:AraC family transcriptional regulator of adaptative response/methylated-DNA-[protein]-cysteine methyltransferase|nr:methylated-DNA--[protein]-cysteine S-methyltransferase [Candidatus Baltobacteraceae bacterium]